jgi:aminoglycoside phosphotransferase (APT) family kinase protein
VSEGQHQQLLTADAVVGFLRARDLVPDRAIVAGDLTVRDVSRRNQSFVVVADDTLRFFVKQPRGSDAVDLVTTEARVYQWLTALPDAATLLPFLPRFRRFDADACALVLDHVGDAGSLAEHHWRRRVPARFGAALGRAIGTLHRVTGAALRAADSGNGIGPAARYLQLHRPHVRNYVQSSTGTIELVRAIQSSSALAALLDDLERGWRIDAVIHADLRWDNCRIVETTGREAARVAIVDWETAGSGDSCWDAGTFFAECLAAWLRSAPATRDSPPEAFLTLSRLPLPRMQPAIRSFWRCYASELALDAPARGDRLIRAVRYAGARLVQHAFEEVQHSTRVNAIAVYLLQLAQNVLQRPVEAAVRLLGLPLPSVADR